MKAHDHHTMITAVEQTDRALSEKTAEISAQALHQQMYETAEQESQHAKRRAKGRKDRGL